MKLALVNPNFNDARASDALPPLVYALLKALTPPGVAVSFYDERVEPLPLETLEADLAALSVQTFTARRAYAVADRLRERGVPVVLGGFHPTLLPEEAALHADAVVVGDAEPVWAGVVEDARAGRLRPVYRGGTDAPLGGVLPDRSVFDGKRYAPVAPVQFGRGCRFSCDFCSVKAFYGDFVGQRPVPEVVEELRGLRGKTVFFVDDNLLVNYGRTVELLDAVAPLGLRWACQISVDAAFDNELLGRMARSGCFLVFLGFESLDPESLREMAKAANVRHRDYAEAVRRFRAFGLMVTGAFVLGYDHDTAATVDEALRFSLDAKLALAHFNTAMPLPATPLYRRLKAQGRLLHDEWWLRPEYRYGDVLFETRGLAPADLAARVFAARREFNSVRNILRRAWEPSSNCRSWFNLRTFLAANVVSRREIRRKQGLRLG